MIGFLVIAHGDLGKSFIHCANHVMGSPPALLKQLGVDVHDDPLALLPQAQGIISELLENGSDGVLVLSDIFGATPCNIASKLMEPGLVEVLSGVNLPMLVRALAYRNEPLATVLEKASMGATAGIVHLSREICGT